MAGGSLEQHFPRHVLRDRPQRLFLVPEERYGGVAEVQGILARHVGPLQVASLDVNKSGEKDALLLDPSFDEVLEHGHGIFAWEGRRWRNPRVLAWEGLDLACADLLHQRRGERGLF